MKLLVEIVLSIVLHPIAMILAWINILSRSDLTALQKVIWIVVCFAWGLGPILYIAVGGGDLW